MRLVPAAEKNGVAGRLGVSKLVKSEMPGRYGLDVAFASDGGGYLDWIGPVS